MKRTYYNINIKTKQKLFSKSKKVEMKITEPGMFSEVAIL